MPGDIAVGKIRCRLCTNTFSSTSTMYRHMRNLHTSNKRPKPNRTSRLKCPQNECSHTFWFKSRLICHLKEKHQIEVAQEDLQFNNLEEFKVWKRGIENKECSFYVKDGGDATLSDGSQRMYYICHRSLDSKVSDEFRHRGGKRVGSNKIGKGCPSSMVVTVDGKVRVNYVSTHVGHDFELGRQPIRRSDRNKIAGMLENGATIDEIIRSYRHGSESQSKRLLLLTRKDLHNIIRDYDILYSPPDDFDCTKLWVNGVHSEVVIDDLVNSKTSQPDNNFLIRHKVHRLSDLVKETNIENPDVAKFLIRKLDGCIDVLKHSYENGFISMRKTCKNDEKELSVLFPSSKRDIMKKNSKKPKTLSMIDAVIDDFNRNIPDELVINRGFDHIYSKKRRKKD